MRISKKDLSRLAGLINSIEVSAMMRAEFAERGETESANRWFERGALKTVELADEFGIELPGLEVCRSHLDWTRKLSA